MQYVPVVDFNQNPLMPTTPNRAARWVKSGKATPFFKKGIFCVRLNQEPSARNKQDISVGIDPGSKREGFTVGSEAHQYLNIQSEAVTHVKDAVEVRRDVRHARRSRNTPYRPRRHNRRIGGIPPSIRARFDAKLRISTVLAKIFPVSHFMIEDIKAHCFGGRRWNASFSPLQIGKEYLYAALGKVAKVFKQHGWETARYRDTAGFKKSRNKLSESFDAHCVDSYVLMRAVFGSYPKPKNKTVMFISFPRLHRRQLHRFQFVKGGIRNLYGGTRSEGFTRGSLVKHPKWMLCYVGGTRNSRISLHDMATGKRLTQKAKPQDCKFLTFNTWKIHRAEAT